MIRWCFEYCDYLVVVWCSLFCLLLFVCGVLFADDFVVYLDLMSCLVFGFRLVAGYTAF